MLTRKVLIHTEILLGDSLWMPAKAITRVAAAAVVRNPFAGTFGDDLSALFDIGRELGNQLMPELTARLPGAPISYGEDRFFKRPFPRPFSSCLAPRTRPSQRVSGL